MNKHLGINNNILELIGNTPMIRLNKITESLKGEYYVKHEGFNPGHSAKDRIALYILEEAERQGVVKKGSTIIETTSGNTGFSMAMVSIIKGYKCILAVSSKSSKDKINMLKAMGAVVHVCPANIAPDDERSYYSVAKRLHQEIEGSIYINQYFNQLNIDAHYHTTGPEIWQQTAGNITHLVAACGTGGTISGTAKYLKEQCVLNGSSIKIIGVDAYGSILTKYHETKEVDLTESYPYKIEGLGKNLIPTSLDFDLIDHFEKVNDEQSAYRAKELALTEGMFVGYTSGAVMQAVLQLSKKGEFKKDSRVVMIFPDHGSRYMSKIYSNKWMLEQGFLDLLNT